MEDFVDFKQRFQVIMEQDLIQPEYEYEYEYESESDGGDFLDELIERGIEYVSGDEEVVDDLGQAEVRALYNEMYRLEVENMRLDHLNFDLKIKCRDYETDLRIATRPVFARVFDLSCFLKETITEGVTMAVDTWERCVDWFRYNHPLNTYRWWLEYRYIQDFEDEE
ncbi:hypothetical protein L6452_23349 [Arctium lappa]|uniref:Uncharacterized protein n=1 Tax=Arctium lappa TaxID=4217 RepID=A0ACB9B271_ARCLA|nr:hypothetical protein L6452_23349 [Arctium lappa]